MKLSEILDHIGGDATEQHDGTLLTNCPAHADSHPSLVIWPGTERTTLTCRAGCGFSDILKAAGLRAEDLKGVDLDEYAPVSSDINAPASDSARNRIAAAAYLWAVNLASDNGHPAKLARERYGADTADADALFELGLKAVPQSDRALMRVRSGDQRDPVYAGLPCRRISGDPSVKRAQVRRLRIAGQPLGAAGENLTFLARTSDGRAAFYQTRSADPDVPKDARWKTAPNPKDGGRWDSAGFVGRVTGDRPVIVTEGLSDAMAVAVLDEFDVIAIRGASQGHRIAELADAIKGRTVYVAGDGDDAGRKFNRLVAAALKGVAASVSAVPVPDGQDLGDIRANAPEGFSAALHDLIEGTPMTAPTGLTDIELAEYAYRTQFAGRLAFSRTQGWRYFPEDGAHWIHDVDGDEVRRRVQRLLRSLLDGAENDRQRMNLGSTSKRNNVVSAMESLDETNYAGGWDETEHLLAAPNGVIDLRTGELVPGTPDQRLSRAVKIPYNPDAKAPRFERFVSEIFAHDPELPAYVQRLLGYGITGSNAEQCFAVLVGEGSNGKSTLLTVLREIMGEHAATVPFDMFTVTGKARGGPETEHLVGARLALASETNRTAILDSAAIKNATGGEEINVNPKYRKPYSFTPQALILLATNYKPIIKEQDAGTWRRVKVLPFLQKFEKDTRLADELRAEYEGILAWLVRGAVEWYHNGLNDPASVTEAIESYRDESDALSGFLPGVLVMDPDRWTSNADIWAAYTEWAEAEGMDAFRRSDTLNKALLERGKGAIVAMKKGGKRGLAGVVLASVLKEEALADASPGIFRHRADEARRATNVG